MKSSITNLSTQFFPSYIRLNQHNFSDLYTIKSTSNCLSKIYQHNFSDLYTIKSTSLSEIYQHNFSTYIRLNQQVSRKFINTIFPSYIHVRLNQQVSQKYISTIFLTYIRLNQQVTVSQKSFHNRLP